MTQPEDSVLSDEQIADRLAALERAGFPQEGIEQSALDLATCCRGTVAEQALAKLLELLEVDRVCRLATEQIRLLLSSRTPTDYCSSSQLLAIELRSHRFHVVSGGGWHLNLPDGTKLAPMLKPVEGEDPGIRLCRLGLLGVWMLTMRSRPPQPPAY